MARPTTDPQPEPDVQPESYRLISETLYQAVLKLAENSQIGGPGGQVADFVNGLRDCPRTHAEPFPRLVESVRPTREQARAAAGEDQDD